MNYNVPWPNEAYQTVHSSNKSTRYQQAVEGRGGKKKTYGLPGGSHHLGMMAAMAIVHRVRSPLESECVWMLDQHMDKLVVSVSMLQRQSDVEQLCSRTSIQVSERLATVAHR